MDSHRRERYYIQYTYVTKDAKLLAGHEAAGAPKKLAHIGLQKEGKTITGMPERPKRKRLPTIMRTWPL